MDRVNAKRFMLLVDVDLTHAKNKSSILSYSRGAQKCFGYVAQLVAVQRQR